MNFFSPVQSIMFVCNKIPYGVPTWSIYGLKRRKNSQFRILMIQSVKPYIECRVQFAVLSTYFESASVAGHLADGAHPHSCYSLTEKKSSFN